MIKHSIFNNSAANKSSEVLAENNSKSGMETRDHGLLSVAEVNGASPKSQTSRGNKMFLMKALIVLPCLLCTVNLFANSWGSISVRSGQSSVLRTPSKAILEFDYSATKIYSIEKEGTQTLEEYLQSNEVKDWQEAQESAAWLFKERFNKKNKGMELTEKESEASYKIIIRVDSLDMGFAGGMFIPFGGSTGGALIIGTIDIIDIKTNEVVCSIYIDKVKGASPVSTYAVRLGLTYAELARRISKLK